MPQRLGPGQGQRQEPRLSLALAWAEALGAFDIFVGVNCVDYSGYPDCRPEYLKAFEAMANLATRAGVEGRRTRVVTAMREAVVHAELAGLAG